MKKLLSILVGLAVIFTANPFFSSTGTAKADDKLYYHLDMGVHVVNKQDGNWIKGGLGEIVTYTLNPTFNNEIEVARVMPLDEARTAGLWKWNTDGYTTSYGAKTELYYRGMYEAYHSVGQSQFKVNTAKGRTISISEAVKLKGFDETYDIVGQYNKFLSTMETTKQVVVSVKNQDILKQIASLKTERNEVGYKIARINPLLVPTIYIDLVVEYNDLTSKINALIPQTTKYSTVEEVVAATKLDVNGFLNEVYKFWGGSAGLKAENLSLWTMMQNMSELKEIPSGTEYYLVFIPTVIEYKITGKICTICGKCVLDPNSPDDHCTSTSCPHFGTTECGCYTEPIVQVTPPTDTTGDCTDKIRWSEIKSHRYYCSGCKTRAGGSKYCPGHTCNHVYTYHATLTSNATLTAAKPNGNATTFKSGYGFAVTMNNSISTVQVSNSGACGKSLTKANDKIPVPPSSAEVRNNWTVKLKDSKYTQPQVVTLAKASSTATTSKFTTAANPLSPTKKALIYTDVALKGTKKRPVKHTITAYTYGGGVNGVQFCKSIPLTFVINGNMYEDDWTVDSM